MCELYLELHSNVNYTEAKSAQYIKIVSLSWHQCEQKCAIICIFFNAIILPKV